MKDLDLYLDLAYNITVTPESCTDGSRCYVARIAELPGCESHGDTSQQALSLLNEAKKLFIASMLQDGIEPPAPQPGYGQGAASASP